MRAFTEADYRPLGDTGMLLSPLALGTVKLGRNTGVKYPQSFDIPDDKAAAKLLDKAAELGINLLDTAPAYGNSEQRMGALLRGRRDHWLLCSKVGEEYENGQSRFDFSGDHTRASIERSLRRLGTDCIDIVLIHSDGNDEAILQDGAALETLLRCREEGKLRALGISTKTVAGGLVAAACCDVVMLTYSPDHSEEIPVLNALARNRKGALIKKALGSGHLNTELKDPVAHNLAFILRHQAVSSIVVGTINPTHLEENVAAALAAVRGESSKNGLQS